MKSVPLRKENLFLAEKLKHFFDTVGRTLLAWRGKCNTRSMAGTVMQLEYALNNNTVRRKTVNSEERKEKRYQQRKANRQQKMIAKNKEFSDFNSVFSFRHLYLSAKKCCKGVCWKSSTQRYVGNIIPEVAKAHRDLLQNKFKHRGFHEFDIMERGKKRHIRAIHISERTVQKCLCDYCLVPIFSGAFIYDNSASLKNRGMDFALRRIKAHLEKHYRRYGIMGGVLLYDFHSFFDTAPHNPLFFESSRRITDYKTRQIANSFIKDFGREGLGMGSQVSQTNALMLPNKLDHLCKEKLGFKLYGRYMDDGYAIYNDVDYLESCVSTLEKTCDEIGISFNNKKTKVVPLKNGFRILKTKFILTNSGKIVLKMNKESTKIIRRKLKKFKKKLEVGEMTVGEIRNSYDSYQGHLKRGNSFKILQKTNHYFKELFGFYPNKRGWKAYVQNCKRRDCFMHSLFSDMDKEAI